MNRDGVLGPPKNGLGVQPLIVFGKDILGRKTSLRVYKTDAKREFDLQK